MDDQIGKAKNLDPPTLTVTISTAIAHGLMCFLHLNRVQVRAYRLTVIDKDATGDTPSASMRR